VTDLIRLLIDVAAAVCPVRVCWTWQRSLYFICGRYQWTGNPGIKFIIPGLCEVKTVSVVPEIYTTPLQTVTLRDGTSLTYSASITVVVRDPAAAYNRLGHYTETVVELAARILSEGLADADPKRFDPARGMRDRLLSEQRDEINAACKEYGLEVTGLGLNNFVRGARTVRLLIDRAVLGEGKCST